MTVRMTVRMSQEDSQDDSQDDGQEDSQDDSQDNGQDDSQGFTNNNADSKRDIINYEYEFSVFHLKVQGLTQSTASLVCHYTHLLAFLFF